jgi:hypothetical protein
MIATGSARLSCVSVGAANSDFSIGLSIGLRADVVLALERVADDLSGFAGDALDPSTGRCADAVSVLRMKASIALSALVGEYRAVVSRRHVKGAKGQPSVDLNIPPDLARHGFVGDYVSRLGLGEQFDKSRNVGADLGIEHFLFPI